MEKLLQKAQRGDEKAFLEDMVGSFKHKFAKKPEVIEGNMNALKRSMQEVKGL